MTKTPICQVNQHMFSKASNIAILDIYETIFNR